MWSINDVASDYLAEVRKKEFVKWKTESLPNQDKLDFEISRFEFIQAWFWGPIEGNLSVIDNTARHEVRFIGYEYITSFTSVIFFALSIVFLRTWHLIAFVFCILFALFNGRISYYLGVAPILGRRLQRSFET
jgi:hypothetical protein